ncbi:MAG TPA: hypothetical protein VM734_23765 [Kofleriaceae bacterium]|nr:hypothetical protein [Kofleriaceae bacterium]
MRAAPSAVAAALVFGSMLVVGGPAADARPKRKVVGDTEDVSKAKKDLVVLRDDEGDVYVIEGVWGEEHWVFYGDGKTMYRQRVFGGGADGSAGTFDYSFWSPRVRHAAIGKKKSGEYYLACADDEIILKKVPDVDARKVLDGAAFKKPFWKRQAQALARDDAGNYYYVDRMRDEHGGKGHRIFAGPKGGMKELPMTNVVSDSVGEIYATKRGELRFVTSAQTATWIKGNVKTELTIIPPSDNIALIYGELGVYDGSLGTPCDDM